MKQKIAIEIISFLFILLFVYAAISKLIDYQKFKIQIGQSPLLTGFGDTIPWMVIASELVISAMLMSVKTRLVGFFCAFCLMIMFTVYIFVLLNFSSYLPCSCGGVLEKLGWTEHLIFNGFFVLLGLSGIIVQANQDPMRYREKPMQNQILEHD